MTILTQFREPNHLHMFVLSILTILSQITCSSLKKKRNIRNDRESLLSEEI